MGKIILLIEDDYRDITHVKKALSQLSVEYTLHIAHNGVEALAILNGNTPDEIKIRPDIILLDINMPKMDGPEFLSIIKNYYSLHNIRIFIMASSAEEYDKVAVEHLGISDYILKPLNFSWEENEKACVTTQQLKSELLMN